jgi:hypothetical protein
MTSARRRRTATTRLGTAGISDDCDDYYYFLAAVGRKSESVATRLVSDSRHDYFRPLR